MSVRVGMCVCACVCMTLEGGGVVFEGEVEFTRTAESLVLSSMIAQYHKHICDNYIPITHAIKVPAKVVNKYAMQM